MPLIDRQLLLVVFFFTAKCQPVTVRLRISPRVVDRRLRFRLVKLHWLFMGILTEFQRGWCVLIDSIRLSHLNRCVIEAICGSTFAIAKLNWLLALSDTLWHGCKVFHNRTWRFGPFPSKANPANCLTRHGINSCRTLLETDPTLHLTSKCLPTRHSI